MLVFLLPLCSVLEAQDTLANVDYGHYNESAIAFGYNYSFDDSPSKKVHLIEAKFWKTHYGGRHPSFVNWHIGSEIALNTSEFVVGPKLGGSLMYGGIILGSHLVFYSNFNKGTLRFVPFMGFGSHVVNLSFNVHTRLINKEYEPVNSFHLNLTVRPFKIKEEKLSYSN